MAKDTPQNCNQQSVQIRQERIHQGPIPNSTEMAKYESIQSGFANRIMTMAEENGRHRREIERINAEVDRDNTRNIIENDKLSIKSFSIGRWLGAFISLIAISGAIYLGSTGGSVIVATALVAFPIASIIQSIVGYKKTKDD
ncbi:DUF2335 domain-containing protein [Orbaceae bacterium ESL0721]|nr:DUF2335 domain-containing protein [Orbaceae bacterium ESL0721]